MKKLLVLALVLLSACKNLETTIDQIAPPSKTSKGDGYIFFDYIAYEQRYNFNDRCPPGRPLRSTLWPRCSAKLWSRSSGWS